MGMYVLTLIELLNKPQQFWTTPEGYFLITLCTFKLTQYTAKLLDANSPDSDFRSKRRRLSIVVRQNDDKIILMVLSDPAIPDEMFCFCSGASRVTRGFVRAIYRSAFG